MRIGALSGLYGTQVFNHNLVFGLVCNLARQSALCILFEEFLGDTKVMRELIKVRRRVVLVLFMVAQTVEKVTLDVALYGSDDLHLCFF